MKKVLVVDDDEMNLKLAEFTLRKEGYEVEKVTSGMEALLYLRDNSADLVLLDIEMPVMNGIKTYEIMKENKEMMSIPTIFLTASMDSEDVATAQNMGAANYIVKPFLPPKLLEAVGKVI